MGSDTVCIGTKSQQMCVKEFEFFLIQNQTGMATGLDGIVGLGPYGTGSDGNGPSFIKRLYDQG